MGIEKAIDMALYRDRVEEICCFGNMFSGYRNMVGELIVRLNRCLENEYRFTTDEIVLFKELHLKYRDWLLKLFLDEDVLFKQCYPDCFGIKYRKRWRVKTPSDFFGSHLHWNQVFLFQTMFDYTEKPIHSDFDLITTGHLYTDEKPTDFGILIYKIRLSANHVLYDLGYTNIDWEIDYIQKVLSTYHGNTDFSR